MELVSKITTASLSMVVPAGGGYYLDSYFGTLPLFTAIGMLLGIAVGLWQLIKIVAYEQARESNGADRPPNDEIADHEAGKSN